MFFFRVGLILVLPCFGFAQAPTSGGPADTKLTFDVAVIKPSEAGAREGIKADGNRFVAAGVNLKLLVSLAYHTGQLAGGEPWTSTDQWSIEAKSDAPGPPPSQEVIAARIRSLLEDRFALRTHSESRDTPVYILSVNPKGPALVAVGSPGDPQPADARKAGPADKVPVPGKIMAGPGRVLGSAITISQLVIILGRAMDRPIVDRTGFSGYVDVNLHFDPTSSPRLAFGATATNAAAGGGAADPVNEPSIFTAIEEQVGLRLTASRAPIETLIIDSARRPGEN